MIGNESAFLVQNLFPVTEKYILNEYVDANTKQPITISKKLMAELHKKARKKIRFNQQGKQLGLSDTVKIYEELRKDTVF